MAYNYGNYPMYNPGYVPSQPYQNQMLMQQSQQIPMQQSQTMQQNTQSAFICFPVTSKEEAVATRVEAFGPAMVMPDLGHGVIYFKRFNEKTALADFDEFRYVEQEQGAEKPVSADYTSIVSGFTTRLDKMGEKLDEIFNQLNQKQSFKQAKGGAEK